MQVLKLVETYCAQALNTIPKLGEELGNGSNGQTFDIANNRVLKLSAIAGNCREKLLKNFNLIQIVLNYVADEKPVPYVSIFQNGYFGDYFNANHKMYYVIYYYIMDKLEKTSSDEKKVFHSVLSHEDNNIKKRFPLRKLKNVLSGLATALDFDMAKVLLFCKQINECLLIHNDIHPRNIMKDNDGNFKLIDIDSCTFSINN